MNKYATIQVGRELRNWLKVQSGLEGRSIKEIVTSATLAYADANCDAEEQERLNEAIQNDDQTDEPTDQP